MDCTRLIEKLNEHIREARVAARAGMITNAEEHISRLHHCLNMHRPISNEQKCESEEPSNGS